MVDCTLIVIHYGDLSLTKSLLRSLEDHPDRSLITEVIVVDNGSELSETKSKQLRQIDIVTSLIKNEEKTYSSGVNAGVDQATGEILLITNNDIEWLPDESVEEVIMEIKKDRAQVAGLQQLYPDGDWQRSIGLYPSILSALCSIFFLSTLYNIIQSSIFKYNIIFQPSFGYIDGAFIAVNAEFFEQVDGFDENFNFYGEDTDFCRRVTMAGGRLSFVPESKIIHVRGGSTSKEVQTEYQTQLARAKKQYVNKHHGKYYKYIYVSLSKISMAMRARIFSGLSIPFGNSWQNRASKARSRFRGFSNNIK